MAANPADPFRPLVPGFDAVLTYGGGDPVVRAYGRFGAPVCVPVYIAVDPDAHHPGPPDDRFACDLAFLDNRLPDREARVEAFFLNAAARCPDHRFLIGGAGWGVKPMPANVRSLGHVYTADHNALNCAARAVLSDLPGTGHALVRRPQPASAPAQGQHHPSVRFGGGTGRPLHRDGAGGGCGDCRVLRARRGGASSLPGCNIRTACPGRAMWSGSSIFPPTGTAPSTPARASP